MDSITEGGSPLPIWRRPKAASIKFDGNVANVRKTYANTYQIFVHLDILWIFWYFPYVVPGAIYLAESVAPYIYIYIYISRILGPRALGVSPRKSSALLRGPGSWAGVWYGISSLEQVFFCFFHHKFEIPCIRRDFFSIHINFFMRIQWNGSRYSIFGHLYS